MAGKGRTTPTKTRNHDSQNLEGSDDDTDSYGDEEERKVPKK